MMRQEKMAAAPIERYAYQDVAGVGDGGDDSGGNHQLLPGLGEVDDVNSFSVAFVHVWVHQVGAVLSAHLDLLYSLPIAQKWACEARGSE